VISNKAVEEMYFASLCPCYYEIVFLHPYVVFCTLKMLVFSLDKSLIMQIILSAINEKHDRSKQSCKKTLDYENDIVIKA